MGEATETNLRHIENYAPWAKWYAIFTIPVSALAVLLTFVALLPLIRQLYNKRFLVVMLVLIQCCYALMALASVTQFRYFLEGQNYCDKQKIFSGNDTCSLYDYPPLNKRNNWNQAVYLTSLDVTTLTHSVFGIKYWLMARKIGNLLVMTDADKYYTWAKILFWFQIFFIVSSSLFTFLETINNPGLYNLYSPSKILQVSVIYLQVPGIFLCLWLADALWQI